MGLKETISMLAGAAAFMPTVSSGGSRRFAEHDHFTPKQWEARKKRLKMQKASRKQNRQHAKR